VRGEITLLVEGVSEEAAEVASDEAIVAEVERRLTAGEGSVKEIAKDLASATGRPRSEVYSLALRAKESMGR
jgi:16S rRNA C1402 (ribose-2'-O) methylase RsmI